MSPRRRKPFKLDLSLDAETRKGVLTVVVFVIAALLLLAMFDLAGRIGISLDQAVAHVFGWERIVLPFFLIAIGYHTLSPGRLPMKATNYIGFLLFFLSLNPLVHVGAFAGTVAAQEALDTAGGKIGMLVADPLTGLFGLFGAGMLFVALFVVSLLLIFNTSLRRVLWILAAFLNVLKRIGLALVVPFRWISKRRSERREQALRDGIMIPDVGGAGVSTSPVGVPLDDVVESDEDAEAEGVSPHISDRTSMSKPKPRKRRPRIEIPLELLTKRDQRPTSGDIDHNRSVIQRTLENFGIPVEMSEVSVGPTVTQFTLKPSEGVKLAKITALHNDLALALAAHPIRIEAPIPGKSLVGIEVPNQTIATVGLRELLESREWRDRRTNLTFSLGKDVSGKPWVADIGRMPHLLVAGATGSGKSVCLNTLLMSLIFSNGPDDLKVILVDPKRVEFPVYNGVPHLIVPVITDVEKTVNALKWALREMDRRFDVLSKFGARDLTSYNARAEEKIPNLVIVVDELADLMMTAMAEVEGAIVRLAQMSRAVGIHLVLATQRPSVDVITGLIKANIPARIAFAVASATDSRTILDQMGAEKLLGRGDMLYSTSDLAMPKRVQGVFISDDEVKRVVEFLKSRYEPADYDISVTDRPAGGETRFTNGIPVEDDTDPMLPDAKEEILRAGKASASLLQRRLKVGYARAARILDLLESEGFIGPGDGAKPREILNVQFTRHLDQVPLPTSESASDIDGDGERDGF
ncbi:DNA translocase FtsK [Patescibacteria group bacterium]|nr:DNA translocase FtsK [Patescibacteria group bacterium]MBU1448934.1 DNA translocase FtsK [Patescibacteria group bacterium]MBU2613153.1 DNA translocase FtsK [Patescibacteria group bacterium]